MATYTDETAKAVCDTINATTGLRLYGGRWYNGNVIALHHPIGSKPAHRSLVVLSFVAGVGFHVFGIIAERKMGTGVSCLPGGENGDKRGDQLWHWSDKGERILVPISELG